MILDEDKYLEHYGILRRSGRYPWGSGKDSETDRDFGIGPNRTVPERSRTFLDHVNNLMSQGHSEAEIAAGFGMTTKDLRETSSIAVSEKKQADIILAQRLKEKGLSNSKIGERMPINGKPRNESSVRALLASSAQEKIDILKAITNELKDNVDKFGPTDIGSGVENVAGVTRTKLDTAIHMLKEQGYVVHNVLVPQLGTAAGNFTKTKVVAPPGTKYLDVKRNIGAIHQFRGHSDDGGRTFDHIQPAIHINANRVSVVYAEQGGAKSDGIIYVRPGVSDISLGATRYAQVRVGVDGTHYLKGMAMYKEDLPPGVDLEFHTAKSSTGNKLDAMKELSKDKDLPFGAMISSQVTTTDSSGKKHVTSVMNKVNDEGDWDLWSRRLSSQTLSKQSPQLAKMQLNKTYESKKQSLDEISRLTNPAVRKKLLETFAEEADSSAVQLHAASLPRSRWHVILPLNSIKETEIYAPNYRHGEQVALIRYPHGGKFEIPELTVNNNNPKAKKAFGQARDAVGINHKVAHRLSGADFDGDAVLVIPNSRSHPLLKTSPALEKLKNFDPGIYKIPADSPIPRMTDHNKGMEMGNISNLITDMTIKGANNDELARAVAHSMVVIDAVKKEYNYKQSALDQNIHQLKVKYQEKGNAGASTLISRATARVYIPRQKPRLAGAGGPIDPATGKKVFVPTGEMVPEYKTITNKTTGEKTRIQTGKMVPRKTRSQKLKETEDARTLLSGPDHVGTKIEQVYADHSNKLKALANDARKAAYHTEPVRYSPSAKEIYAPQVKTLNASLNVALKNRPAERKAQMVANTMVSAKLEANPGMEADSLKKVKAQALNEARNRIGAGKIHVDISDIEWEAIQAGAISNHKLTEILKNTDIDKVKKLATPRKPTVMTAARQTRAKAMLAAGKTPSQIADTLGVALSTLESSLDLKKKKG